MLRRYFVQKARARWFEIYGEKMAAAAPGHRVAVAARHLGRGERLKAAGGLAVIYNRYLGAILLIFEVQNGTGK